MRPSALLVALVMLAALLVAVAAPPTALAAETTLVSNTGESTPSAGSPFRAQSFTTGAQGATISEIQVKLIGHSGDVSVKLRKDATSGCPTGIGNCPGDLVATFTNPSSIVAGLNSFTAPAGTKLDASTTYWVTLHEGVSNRRNIPVTASDNQTGTTGWTIGDGSLWRQSESSDWQTSTNSLAIAVKGELRVAEFVSAEVNGTKLSIDFGESLNTTSVPATTDFGVTVGDQPRSVAAGGVAIADTKVTLTLADPAVTVGQTVTVSYTKPSGDGAMPLKDAADVDVETFGAQPVTNTTAPLIESVSLVSKPRATLSDSDNTKVYGVGQNIVVAVTWNGRVSWDVSGAAADGIGVRLNIGGTNQRAQLVTDGATSGTATTLWFSHTVASGDSDNDGVATALVNNKLVLLGTGATLKGAEGTDAAQSDAGVTHAGLGNQSAHKVVATRTPVANRAPAFDDGDDSTQGMSMGTLNAIPGTLVHQGLEYQDSENQIVPFFSDADKDSLRFTFSATRLDALEVKPRIIGTRLFLQTARSCVLEDLLPALQRNNNDEFENVVTVAAFDPDGASVSATLKLLINWDCGEFVSATVNGSALKLTFSNLPGSSAPWFTSQFGGLAADQFEVKVNGSEVALAAANTFSVSGNVLTVNLAAAVTRGQTVTASYEPGIEEVRGLSDQPVVNLLNTAPESASMTGNTLTVTFTRDLKVPDAAALAKLVYAFRVTGVYWEGAPLRNVSPQTVAVSGKTVTLTLGTPEFGGRPEQGKWDLETELSESALSPGRDVRVEYLRSVASGFGVALLDNADSTEVPGFTDYAVTTTFATTEPPLATGVQVDGTALTLSFDQDLDTASLPAGSRFRVSTSPRGLYINPHVTVPRAISGTGTAAVSGKTVTVTLESAVDPEEDFIVWYRPGDDANPLRASSTGPKVAEILGALGSRRDRTAPALDSAVVAGTSLWLYYSEKLDTGSVPSTGDFTVMEGTTARTESDVTVSGNAVKLTLSGNAVGTSTAVTVGYTAGTNPVQDLAGNDAGNLSSHSVTNAGDNPMAAPTLSTTDPAVADQLVLRLTFNQWLDGAEVPGAGAFTIAGGDTPMSVRGVAVRGKSVELRVSPGFLPCSSGYTVSYTKPSSNALQSVWGTDVEAISSQAITNKWSARCRSTDPQPRQIGNSDGVVGGLGGRSLSLEFDRPLSPLQPPSPEGFTVKSSIPGGAAAMPVEVVEIRLSPNDRQLQMALSRQLTPGEQVAVNYQHPRSAPGIWDAEGDQIAPFSVETVVPGAAPEVTGVEVVSDSGDDNTYAMGEVIEIKVTFDKAVTVTGTPLLGIDMDPAHWGRKDAVYASGSGTAELIFTHTVIEPNYSSQGIAVLADTLDLDGGTITATAGGTDADLSHTGLGHDSDHKVDWRQSPPDANGNRSPVFGGVDPGWVNAPPGYLVSLSVSQSDFSDPDGDTLTFTLSTNRDDIYAAGDLVYVDRIGRIFFAAKTACALASLDPPESGTYDTVVTMTATDPDGATAQVSATFRTNPATFACPSLSTATVDGATLTMAFNGALAPSYKLVPANGVFEALTAGQFEVEVDGAAVSLADAVSVSGDAIRADNLRGPDTISLTLAEAVTAGQTVTVSYTPGNYPLAAAFTDQPTTNTTTSQN